MTTDNADREELKPCWCRSGTRALSVKVNMDHGDFACRERGRYVYCSNCWTHGPTFNTDAEAKDGWNRSHAVAAPRGDGKLLSSEVALKIARHIKGNNSDYYSTVQGLAELESIISRHFAAASLSPAASSLIAEQGIDFSCRVCGVQCTVAPDPPARAVCPEHCEDHDYEYVKGEGGHFCKHCGEQAPEDWYDD